MDNLLFKNIILPAYLNYKGSKVFDYYKLIIKNNNLTKKELEKIQWYKLKMLIEHCYNKIPYYNNMFNELKIKPNDIQTIKDYSQLPTLKKQNIRDNYKELINPELKENEICYSSTGGSTGIPLKIYKSIYDQDNGFAIRYRSNSWTGWHFWEKTAWLVADLKRLSELELSPSIKNKIGLAIKRKLILDTRNCDESSMHKWVEQIKKYKPKHFYGYSSLLSEFSKFIVENNIKIDGIKGVYSTAEPLNQRELISKAFNATVYDQYGSSEIPCIAHECKNGNMHLNIDQVLTEFISNDRDSNIKDVICTPLYVYGMPLLRYELGDTATYSNVKCNCGLEYPVIELNIGRLSDNLLSPKGKLTATANIGWHLAQITNEIKQFQIIQNTLNDITIKLSVKTNYNKEDENSIVKLIKGLLDDNSVNISFEYVDEIPPEHNGKYRPVISKVIEGFQMTKDKV